MISVRGTPHCRVRACAEQRSLYALLLRELGVSLRLLRRLPYTCSMHTWAHMAHRRGLEVFTEKPQHTSITR
jgi:hypothetical protein